jgi:hypothetical protein
MKTFFCKLLLLVFLLAIPLHADESPLVVASIRQYLVQGDSTVHLYLYGSDGKLQKQLTSDPGQNDREPAFSHDGKSILFSRLTADPKQPNQTGRYVLTLADGKITRLNGDAVPKDYSPTMETASYGGLAFDDPPAAQPDGEDKKEAFYTAPDKSAKLILLDQPNPNAPDHYLIRYSGSDKPIPIESLPGYTKGSDTDISDNYLVDKRGPFLIGPDHYSALFMIRHTYSLWVFDVTGKTWHALSPESSTGDIYAVKEKAGFYFLHCGMEDLGKTGKSVWCGYLESWDGHFKPTVLAPPLSVFYGAGIYYRAGQTAAIEDPKRGS